MKINNVINLTTGAANSALSIPNTTGDIATLSVLSITIGTALANTNTLTFNMPDGLEILEIWTGVKYPANLPITRPNDTSFVMTAGGAIALNTVISLLIAYRNF